MTAHLNDLSCVGRERDRSAKRARSTTEGVVRETPEVTAVSVDRGASPPIKFFAVVKSGALHPLDDVALEPGARYLVEIREAVDQRTCATALALHAHRADEGWSLTDCISFEIRAVEAYCTGVVRAGGELHGHEAVRRRTPGVWGSSSAIAHRGLRRHPSRHA